MNEGKELVSLKRIFFLLVITLTISLAGAFVYIYIDTRQDRINDLSYTASVIREYYELSFHQWELSLISVGKRLSEIEAYDQQMAYAEQALSIYEKELLAFGFARPDGQVILYKGTTPANNLPNLMSSPQTRRSFELTKERDHITLGECYYFINVNDWILPIRVGIKDADGNLIAVNTSAIDYSSVVEDLEGFGFNENYQIHLINKDFGTTQILYPLEKENYTQVLGKDTLDYEVASDELKQLTHEAYLFSSTNPFGGTPILAISSEIDPVNHQLVVSVPKSFITSEVLEKFKFIGLAYLALILSSVLLYYFLKRNLEKSFVELQTERANLKAIIESTQDVVGLFNKNSELIEFNRSFQYSALSTDGIELRKGINVFPLMKSQEHAARFKEFFQRALSGEKFNEVVNYPGAEGEIVFQFTYNPIYRNDEIVGLSLFAKDITEVKKYQTQLEEYNKNLERLVKERTDELEKKNQELTEGYQKLKSAQQQLIKAEKMASLGVLAAGIGHEINNPLNFIKHGAEGLEDELRKNKKVDFDQISGYFVAISEGVKRATDIVSGISHFSRTGGDLKEDCNIHEILNNCLAIVATRFRDRNIAVKTDFHENDPVIKGNDGKLHQVFTNIIVNAEQAIEGDGQIEISTEAFNDKVKISIRDTGKGMTEEVLNRMTDPFFTTKEPGEGTGLGMFITQLIIDEHNGGLEVDSELGTGTTFTITLPRS
ncbi:MAG: hypothetical protein Tsb0034_01960 [Ekhidna sp.]